MVSKMAVCLSHEAENVRHVYGAVFVLLEDLQGLLVVSQGLGAVSLAAVDAAKGGEHGGEAQDFIFLLF